MTATLDIDKIRPINRKLLVRKCVNDHARDENGEVLIYLPDESYEQCYFVEILKVSDDCRQFTQDMIGKGIQVPDFITGLQGIDQEAGLFMVSEDILDECLEMGLLFEMGE